MNDANEFKNTLTEAILRNAALVAQCAPGTRVVLRYDDTSGEWLATVYDAP